jgi:hypothetical protein
MFGHNNDDDSLDRMLGDVFPIIGDIPVVIDEDEDEEDENIINNISSYDDDYNKTLEPQLSQKTIEDLKNYHNNFIRQSTDDSSQKIVSLSLPANNPPTPKKSSNTPFNYTNNFSLNQSNNTLFTQTNINFPTTYQLPHSSLNNTYRQIPKSRQNPVNNKAVSPETNTLKQLFQKMREVLGEKFNDKYKKDCEIAFNNRSSNVYARITRRTPKECEIINSIFTNFMRSQTIEPRINKQVTAPRVLQKKKKKKKAKPINLHNKKLTNKKSGDFRHFWRLILKKLSDKNTKLGKHKDRIRTSCSGAFFHRENRTFKGMLNNSKIIPKRIINAVKTACKEVLKENKKTFKKTLKKEKEILNDREIPPSSDFSYFWQLLKRAYAEDYKKDLKQHPDAKKIQDSCRQAFDHKGNSTFKNMLKKRNKPYRNQIRALCKKVLEQNKRIFAKTLAREKEILDNWQELSGSFPHFCRLLTETLWEDHEIDLDQHPDNKEIIDDCREAFKHRDNNTFKGLFARKKINYHQEIKDTCIKILSKNDDFEDVWEKEQKLPGRKSKGQNTKKNLVSNNSNVFFSRENRKRKRQEYESDNDDQYGSDNENNEFEREPKKHKSGTC